MATQKRPCRFRRFVKMDTEQNFDVPARYGIRSLPTLLVFKGGRQVEQFMGLRPKVDMKRSMGKALA